MAHWAGTSSGRWSGTTRRRSGSWRPGPRGELSGRGGGAKLSDGAVWSSRDDGGEEETAQIKKWLSVGTGGERKKGSYIGGAFCPGSSHHPGRPFCPGWWLDPGQKVFFCGPRIPVACGPPLLPGGSITRDKRGPVFIIPAKSSSLSFVSFYFYFKIGYHLLIELKNYGSKNYQTIFLILFRFAIHSKNVSFSFN